MKNKIFWTVFVCLNLVAGFVLVSMQTELRREHMETIYPYLDGYKESLLKAGEVLDANVTGDNLRTDVWNLRLVEENLKMCAYYAQSWASRAGFVNRKDFNLEGYFLREKIKHYRNPGMIDPQTNEPFEQPTIEEIKADFAQHSQHGARLMFDDYEENYAHYAELFGWESGPDAGGK